ncbi:MAG TPA: ABC transporter ATP-binding protein [Synergistaceae bacterium]|nr:ABC transporter ATP-binding protein [Synergistaceae bacterium]
MIRLQDVRIDLPGFSLAPLSLTVEEGEFFMLVGPSGAGKTMILEAIAGLQPHEGEIFIDDEPISKLPPEKRRVALVYQDYALFPHLSVRENIAYPLRFSSRETHREHVKHLTSLLRLEHLLERFPGTLSGGEQQRVALARALAAKPRLLLLDEPLAALDPLFREEIQEYLRRLHEEEGFTILMVTHDFGEVLSLGERVAVLREGILQQTGSVESVFRTPANREVATFVGMKNIFAASVHRNMALLEEGAEFVLAVETETDRSRCFVGIRPEHILLGNRPWEGTDAINAFSGIITSVVPREIALEVTLESSHLRLTAHVLGSTFLDLGLRQGQQGWMFFKPESVHLF